MKNYFRQMLLVITVLTLPMLAPTNEAHAIGFTNMSSMTTAREWHTSNLLGNGKIFVPGGYVSGGAFQTSAELFGPTTGKYSPTSSTMNSARAYHTSTVLPNGKVLVAGGYDGTSETASAELYDPASGIFTSTGNLITKRRNQSATMLSDGKVLIAGGFYSTPGPPYTVYLDTAEIYDPATGAFTATSGSLTAARANHTATLLADGKVLIAGGASGSALNSAELFDPAAGNFTATGNLGFARTSHSATLLANGKVLIAGGGSGAFPYDSAELFDPTAGTFTGTGNMANFRQQHTATLLPDGSVLITGGYQGSVMYTNTAERYDPASGLFSAAGNMSSPRSSHTATLLPDGRVIIVGGYDGFISVKSTEAYYPAISKIAAGYNHTAIVKTDGSLWTWGVNGYGQLGDYTLSQRNVPVKIGSDYNWASIAAGYDYTLAVKANGTLWGWGSNIYGQLGDGSTLGRNFPGQIGSDAKWAAVAAGSGHTLALKTDGSLWAWGYNSYGQLGDNNQGVDNYTPTQVGTDLTWKSISAGAQFSMAIKSDGTLWAWGENNNGNLGKGNTITYPSPVQVGTDTDWSSISAGSSHTVATKSSGTLWGWGYNGWGQLGRGTDYTSYNVPTQIGTNVDWQSASAFSSHTGALKTDGTLWMFGANSAGQIGNGSTGGFQLSPLKIGAATDWSAVVVGSEHSAAVKSDGSLWTWGSNLQGQLGDGAAINKNAPGKSFLIQTKPMNGDMNIPLNTTISAIFSSAMDGTTINAATFTLSDGVGSVAGTVAYNDVTRTATFTASANLIADKIYTATLTTGVTESGGTPLAAPFIWSFANDTLPPTTGTLTASPGYNEIVLTWSGFSDPSGIAFFKLISSTTGTPVDCNGTAIFSGFNTTFTETSLPDAATRYYGLCAADKAGNSTIIPVTTSATTLTPSVLPFSETFDPGALPPGWSLINDGSGDWQFSTSVNATGGSGGFATVGTYTWDAELRTPKIDMSSATKPTLEFKTDYTGANDNLVVDVSTDGGTNWTPVWSWLNAGPITATTVSIDITAAVAADPANVTIRFHYLNGDNTTGDWSADDVKVFDNSPALSVTPASPADFGSVVYGNSQSRVVTITNNGFAPLVISSTSITSGATDFSVSTTGSGGDCLSLAPTIAPGGSCTVTALFTPTASSLINGKLSIVSNDPVSPTGITLSGTGVPATPVITWATAVAITYGTALSATQLNATASMPGTYTYTPASGTFLNAGTQVLSVTFTPTDTANYNTASGSSNVTINMATPTITWSNPADITYGTALSATQLNAAASVAGTFVYTPPAGTVLNVGASQTLSTTFTPTDSVNYNTQAANVSISVNAAPAIDTTPPVVSTVEVPPTSSELTIPINNVTATDNVAISDYLVTESTKTPAATDPGWKPEIPTDYTCKTWGNNIFYTFAKDQAGNVSTAATAVVFVGYNPATDGVIVPAAASAPPKLEPDLADAMKSLNFAMKNETPSPAEIQHGKVAPLVNGIPKPDASRSELNLGDTIVILRRVVGL